MVKLTPSRRFMEQGQ